jgi:hypothetical protein
MICIELKVSSIEYFCFNSKHEEDQFHNWMFNWFETNRKQLLTFSMLETFNVTSKSTLLQLQRQQQQQQQKQQSNTERQLRVMLNEERERSNIYEICIQPSGTQHHHNVVNQIDKKLGLFVFYLSFTVDKHFRILVLLQL